jgi:hypothetical protein
MRPTGHSGVDLCKIPYADFPEFTLQHHLALSRSGTSIWPTSGCLRGCFEHLCNAFAPQYAPGGQWQTSRSA